ncbi:MAG: hypothetical protein WCG23_10120 [bacterium]
MKEITIREFNPCRCFKSHEDARNWLLKNIYRLEELIHSEIKEPKYLDDVPEFIRPDIYGKIRGSLDLLVVSINLDKEITNDDLKKFLDTVAFNDASLAIWVLTDIDERLQCMLEWISQKMEPKVEFLILKMSAFRIENSGPVLSLDRM